MIANVPFTYRNMATKCRYAVLSLAVVDHRVYILCVVILILGNGHLVHRYGFLSLPLCSEPASD